MEKPNFSTLVGKDNSDQVNHELPLENLEEPKIDLSFIKQNKCYIGSNGIYKVGKRFGQGGYGMVYRGTNIQTNEKVAIKIVPFKRFSTSQKKFVYDGFKGEDPLEHQRLLEVQEVNGVIKLFDFFQLPEGSVYIMQMPENCRTLLEYIRVKHPLTEIKVQDIFSQILQILIDCHSKGVFHRDVKPENLLIDGNGKIFLIDFGLALPVNEEGYSSREFAGTWIYFPPEKYNAEKYHAETATLWSVGIVLFEMLFNDLPFNFELSLNGALTDSMFNRNQICCAHVKFRGLSRSLACQDLITKLLAKNPSQRFKFADALAHSWNQPAWNSGRILKFQSQKRTYSESFANNAQAQIELGSDGRSAGPDSKKYKYSPSPSSYTYNQTTTNIQALQGFSAQQEYSQSYASSTYDHTTVHQPQATNIQALRAQLAPHAVYSQALYAEAHQALYAEARQALYAEAQQTLYAGARQAAYAEYQHYLRAVQATRYYQAQEYSQALAPAPAVTNLDLQSPPTFSRLWAL